MINDLALRQRRAWLQTLGHRRYTTSSRHFIDALVGWIVPSKRRSRALLRQALVRI